MLGLLLVLEMCFVDCSCLCIVSCPAVLAPWAAGHETTFCVRSSSDTTVFRSISFPRYFLYAVPVVDLSQVSLKGSLKKSQAADLLSPTLTQEDVDSVEKFVFFIGYARSGSSIVASMMDAHPNMIITQECHEFLDAWLRPPQMKIKKNALFKILYQHSYYDATRGIRSPYKGGMKGYTLRIESAWQGRYKTLKVIGDKQAAKTTAFYASSPSLFTDKYRQLAKVVKVPIYVIHVCRNPFDMITTRLIYNQGPGFPHKLLNSSALPHVTKYSTAIVTETADKVFESAKAVQGMIKASNLKVLHVHTEELVRDPKSAIQSICDFLQLECPEDYLQQCQDKTFHTVSRTRDLVVWSPGLQTYVETKMNEFSFFHGYSFVNNFFSPKQL